MDGWIIMDGVEEKDSGAKEERISLVKYSR